MPFESSENKKLNGAEQPPSITFEQALFGPKGWFGAVLASNADALRKSLFGRSEATAFTAAAVGANLNARSDAQLMHDLYAEV